MSLTATRWTGAVLLLCFSSLTISYVAYTRAAHDAATPDAPSAAAVAQNNLGVGYMNRYNYKDAAESFKRALSLDPGFKLARVNLGIAYFYGQNLEEATATLRVALARDADNPYIHYTLGLALKTLGDSEAAVQEFARVTEIDAGDAETWYNLGVLCARLRRNEEGEGAFRRALDLQPMNTSAMYNLGMLLLKQGRTEEGGAIMEQFRPLQQKGNERADLTLGTQYGEMGRYALAVNYLPAFRTAAAASLSGEVVAPFKDISSEAGLAMLFKPAPRAQAPAAARPATDRVEKLKPHLLPKFAGSIALSDLDNDGDVDVLLTRHDGVRGQWQTLLLQNNGKGRFKDATAPSGLINTGSQVSAAIGDYDNDGRQDVYLVGFRGNSLFRNLGNGRFENVTEKAGVADGGLAVSVTFVDYDHDGDLDLFVSHYPDIDKLPAAPGDPLPLRRSSNRMFRNNRNGTFTDFTDTLGVGTNKYQGSGMIPSDIDEDRDVDLIVLNQDGPPQIFLNERNDVFIEQSARLLAGLTGLFRSLTVADFNQDGSMDIFLTAGAERPNVLLLNRGDGSMAPDTRSPELLRAGAGEERCATGALDYDNDGDLDIYVWNCGAAGALWRNLGDGQYEYAGRLGTHGGASAAAADLDGDGRVDMMVLDPAGSPRLLKNIAGTRNRWIGVRLEGLRSNPAGIGAKVEIRTGLLYQKFEVQAHNGFRGQDPPIIWCGLGSATRADTVTVRWPSGILQSEVNVPAGAIVRVKELNRKGTSCPLLYTWNGKGFQFVTDFLGGCAIGYLVGPGRYGMPDTDEYVLIGARDLVPREGKYLVNMANQLEETIMFDEVQLLVVDHPAGTEMYPNERLVSAPPFPEFRIYTARNPRLPVSAVDDKGNNVLPLIAKKDRTYPASFRLLPFKGYAESHDLILDLGPLPGAGKILLLMDAWIDYADSSSNLAASQAGISLEAPSLQVRDRSGEWKTVLPSMGFPAGLPRTMVVDLTGKFLCDDPHVRIVTNMRIYWDRIRVDTSDDEQVRVTRLDPSSADLHFLGYPAYYTPDGKEPRIYDYRRILPTDLWLTHAGAYTRFGDVRELLLKRDDIYVISRHGDEISLSFDAGSVPPLPAGWARDYLFYADGYGKDMDLNSLHPEVIGPLPFHAMSRFPYPSSEKYPEGDAHRRYRTIYNTRVYP